ncbi:murein biosynthesis integral membrane protein MurJ [Streptomyces sp. URMC 123]|uniref:murein biosynthesis integral membrane protein MurJ n=1 Tax=Streptomyces sp. URMC 123 TaxID=3423403 RepID=UPI003F19933F
MLRDQRPYDPQQPAYGRSEGPQAPYEAPRAPYSSPYPPQAHPQHPQHPQQSQQPPQPHQPRHAREPQQPQHAQQPQQPRYDYGQQHQRHERPQQPYDRDAAAPWPGPQQRVPGPGNGAQGPGSGVPGPGVPDPVPAPVPEPFPAASEPPAEPQPAASSGGRAAGLLKSSALMAAGTMVSRLTGFAKSALIVAALGVATLGDSYNVATLLPNMIFFLTVGGGLNSVFVPQLVRAMKEDDDGGEAYANRLLTLVAVILGALVLAATFAAPLLVRMVSAPIASNPAANEVTVTFVRYCLPTIFFMGIHVVMGQILNARGRFGAMMWTPVLNNIVVITTFALFLWVYGTAGSNDMGVATIPDEGVRLLGVGTLLGLVVQALAMIPYLREAGFKVRPRFDWRGHGLGKAAKLARWTVLFVFANQAGVIVVTQLATSAGLTAEHHGHPGTGIAAYMNAQLIWNMPQAIITVSVMAALLPRISRAASDGDHGAVRDDISQGLRNSAVAIVPISFGFLALGVPMCTLIYGASGLDQAQSMGYMLMAFGLGLIPFSVQYVVLRGFYAFEDTRTPFYNTVIVAAVNAATAAACFLLLPAHRAVLGMAACYGLAYAIGVGVAWRRLSKRLGGDLDGSHVLRTYARLAGASIPAAIAAGAAAYGVNQALGYGTLGSLAALFGGAIVLLGVFYLAAKRMRVEELTAMVGMVRGRLGR